MDLTCCRTKILLINIFFIFIFNKKIFVIAESTMADENKIKVTTDNVEVRIYTDSKLNISNTNDIQLENESKLDNSHFMSSNEKLIKENTDVNALDSLPKKQIKSPDAKLSSITPFIFNVTKNQKFTKVISLKDRLDDINIALKTYENEVEQQKQHVRRSLSKTDSFDPLDEDSDGIIELSNGQKVDVLDTLVDQLLLFYNQSFPHGENVSKTTLKNILLPLRSVFGSIIDFIKENHLLCPPQNVQDEYLSNPISLVLLHELVNVYQMQTGSTTPWFDLLSILYPNKQACLQLPEKNRNILILLVTKLADYLEKDRQEQSSYSIPGQLKGAFYPNIPNQKPISPSWINPYIGYSAYHFPKENVPLHKLNGPFTSLHQTNLPPFTQPSNYLFTHARRPTPFSLYAYKNPVSENLYRPVNHLIPGVSLKQNSMQLKPVIVDQLPNEMKLYKNDIHPPNIVNTNLIPGTKFIKSKSPFIFSTFQPNPKYIFSIFPQVSTKNYQPYPKPLLKVPGNYSSGLIFPYTHDIVDTSPHLYPHLTKPFYVSQSPSTSKFMDEFPFSHPPYLKKQNPTIILNYPFNYNSFRQPTSRIPENSYQFLPTVPNPTNQYQPNGLKIPSESMKIRNRPVFSSPNQHVYQTPQTYKLPFLQTPFYPRYSFPNKLLKIQTRPIFVYPRNKAPYSRHPITNFEDKYSTELFINPSNKQSPTILLKAPYKSTNNALKPIFSFPIKNYLNKSILNNVLNVQSVPYFPYEKQMPTSNMQEKFPLLHSTIYPNIRIPQMHSKPLLFYPNFIDKLSSLQFSPNTIKNNPVTPIIIQQRPQKYQNSGNLYKPKPMTNVEDRFPLLFNPLLPNSKNPDIKEDRNSIPSLTYPINKRPYLQHPSKPIIMYLKRERPNQMRLPFNYKNRRPVFPTEMFSQYEFPNIIKPNTILHDEYSQPNPLFNKQKLPVNFLPIKVLQRPQNLQFPTLDNSQYILHPKNKIFRNQPQIPYYEILNVPPEKPLTPFLTYLNKKYPQHLNNLHRAPILPQEIYPKELHSKIHPTYSTTEKPMKNFVNENSNLPQPYLHYPDYINRLYSSYPTYSSYPYRKPVLMQQQPTLIRFKNNALSKPYNLINIDLNKQKTIPFYSNPNKIPHRFIPSPPMLTLQTTEHPVFLKPDINSIRQFLIKYILSRNSETLEIVTYKKMLETLPLSFLLQLFRLSYNTINNPLMTTIQPKSQKITICEETERITLSNEIILYMLFQNILVPMNGDFNRWKFVNISYKLGPISNWFLKHPPNGWYELWPQNESFSGNWILSWHIRHYITQ